ncbi:MAG: cytochrome-c peroxidase [Deltaproteobacteria bacterium]|nr:MAG: cytochrome-c peroxidase [Deltaproteobacteria bacterium]
MRDRLRVPSIPSTVALAAVVACGGRAEPERTPPRKAAPSEAASSETAKPGPPAPAARDDAKYAWKLPTGIAAPPPVPADNPMTPAKVALGERLFFDGRLSVDGSRSCYSCHRDACGNADCRVKALGAGDKPLPRNTPTIWNVGFRKSLYWDGRAPSLEKQALGALKGGNMGLGDGLAAKAAEIGKLPEYASAFAEAFGLEEGATVTPDHVAKALSAYERTLLCGDTAFDRKELSPAAERGFALFTGKAGCISCHAGQDFTDGLFHNVGIGVPADGKPTETADTGRMRVTKDPADAYRFRTPTLRNVAKTAPYFHDGSVADLTEAVRIMASGGRRVPGVDPLLQDRKLSDAEIADIVAFLESLTCPGTLERDGGPKDSGKAPPSGA